MLPTTASPLAVPANSGRVASRVAGATRAAVLANQELVAIANRAAVPDSHCDHSHHDDAEPE